MSRLRRLRCWLTHRDDRYNCAAGWDCRFSWQARVRSMSAAPSESEGAVDAPQHKPGTSNERCTVCGDARRREIAAYQEMGLARDAVEACLRHHRASTYQSEGGSET